MFLNWKRLGADLQTKIEELQIINQSLRENYKVKEDELVHLSDQLLEYKHSRYEIKLKIKFKISSTQGIHANGRLIYYLYQMQ
jgi:hypothetical protein